MKPGRSISALGLAFATAAASCAPAGPTSSVVAGTIDTTGLPAGAWTITLVNDLGQKAHAKLDAGGSFNAKLEQGATWSLYLTSADTALPIVLRETDGRLETSVLVETGGAHVDLGLIRFWAGDAAAARKDVSRALELTPGADARPQPSGDASMTCDAGDGDDGDGDDGDGDGDDGDDGDGTDAENDLTVMETASPQTPVAVGTSNLPLSLACDADDGDDGDGDDGDDGDGHQD